MIRNTGQTCFFATACQCIARTPGFVDRYLLHEGPNVVIQFLHDLRHHDRRIHDPTPVYQEFHSRFPPNKQHDCHEAVLAILEYLHGDTVRTFFYVNDEQLGLYGPTSVHAYPPIMIIRADNETQTLCDQVAVQNEVYNVFAVCLFVPMGAGGHYVALVRSGSGHPWTVYDDEHRYDFKQQHNTAEVAVMFMISDRFHF